ncbi:hypothetical protein V8E53_012750 [Lactarius tabidus]
MLDERGCFMHEGHGQAVNYFSAHPIRTATPPSLCLARKRAEVTGTLLERAVHRLFIILRSGRENTHVFRPQQVSFQYRWGKEKIREHIYPFGGPTIQSEQIYMTCSFRATQRLRYRFTLSPPTPPTFQTRMITSYVQLVWAHVMGLPGTKAGSFREDVCAGLMWIKNAKAHIGVFRTDYEPILGHVMHTHGDLQRRKPGTHIGDHARHRRRIGE